MTGVQTCALPISLGNRLKDADVLALIENGRGAMPPSPLIGDDEKRDLLDFLFRRNQPAATLRRGDGKEQPRYTFDGFKFLTDHEGYPGIKPPWGLLNCYDLGTGRALWRVPLGELEKLTAQGVPKTGSQTLGGHRARVTLEPFEIGRASCRERVLFAV